MNRSRPGWRSEITEFQERAYQILKSQDQPVMTGDFGWLVWGETTDYPERGTGSHQQNKFCRVAKKLLMALERQGKAARVYSFDKANYKWTAILSEESNEHD